MTTPLSCTKTVISAKLETLEPNASGSALITPLTTSSYMHTKIFTHQSYKLALRRSRLLFKIDQWSEEVHHSVENIAE